MTMRCWWSEYRDFFSFIFIIVFVAVVFAFTAAMVGGTRPVQQCPEDAVLIGQGDFAKGRWSEYVCGPAVDDWGE